MRDPRPQQSSAGGSDRGTEAPQPLSLVFRVPGLGSRQREHPQQHVAHARTSKRRAVGASEVLSDDTSSASESASSSTASSDTATVVVNAVPKKKTRWLAARKIERRALEHELARLQDLKQRHDQSLPNRTIAVLVQQQCNEQLRTAIFQQQLQLARAQSAILGASITQLHAPFAQLIHLSRDWRDRAATLAALKSTALQNAEQFVEQRAQSLDPRVAYSQTDKRELLSGDVVLTGFHSLPLDNFAGVSVREIYTAIRQFYFNMEITYTERSGELMLREGDFDEVSGYTDGQSDPDVKTQRLVRTTAAGTPIESNAVLFCGLRHVTVDDESSISSNDDDDSAVVVVDSIDLDELFPRRGGACVRQDTTAALCIRRWHADDSSSNRSSTAAVHQDATTTGLVLTGAFFARLSCDGSAKVPSDAVESMAFGSAFCFKTLVQTISATVRSSSAAL